MTKILMGKRQLTALVKLLGASALLLLYAIGSTQTGFLHQLFHPDEVAAIHSPKQEENPCHRALYHGMDTGCRHEFHLVKVHSCGLCHTLVHTEMLLFDGHAGGPTRRVSELVERLRSRCTTDITNAFLTRGPPVELHA
jgi:hypothetical protein